MKLLQVAEQNKPYYSADYVNGFNDGAKAQYEADKKEAEQQGRWLFDIDNKEWFWGKPYMCDQCGKLNERSSNYCPNGGARTDGEEE